MNSPFPSLLALDSFCDPLSSSHIFTHDSFSPNKSHLVHENRSHAKSNRSNRSKYTNSSKLTRSNFYETLRRGNGLKMRKEEELDAQLNLLRESLHILEQESEGQRMKMGKEMQELAKNSSEVCNELRKSLDFNV